MPQFLLDEHVWGGLVEVGQELGADVLLVQTRLAAGADDEAVLAFAASQRRILYQKCPVFRSSVVFFMVRRGGDVFSISWHGSLPGRLFVG
jgi:hypothetical protein